MLGVPDRADPLWAGIEREFADAATRVPVRLRGASVYFEVSPTPHAAGSTSFIGQTLARLGLVNIAPPALGAFPQLNPEFVVRAQPDVVIGPRADVQAMPARPGWAGLRALQRGQVCAFDNGRYELLLRPGPRLGEAARVIADCLAALPAR
jgi:iron complex transport system substrate-binding protein